MIGLVSFSFKILFASILGGSLNYKANDNKDSNDILETSLICIFSASILGLTSQFSGNNKYLSMAFGILAVVILIISISKNLKFISRIVWIFSSIIGMIIGAGYFLQASILCVLVYFIIHNSKTLLEYVHKESEDVIETMENISN